MLAEAAESVQRFVHSGLGELGDKLGPILWQFMPTKRFERDDFSAFLDLLPENLDERPLRHALEVRHDSFRDPVFVDLARARGAAIVFADSGKHPCIADPTADFIYARLQDAREDVETGYTPDELDRFSDIAKAWGRGEAPAGLDYVSADKAEAKARDVFVFMINGAKVRAPRRRPGPVGAALIAAPDLTETGRPLAAPVAALDRVEVDYGGRPALGPLSLEVAPREVVALVGPSGCGKSTALRLLAGLERPSRGEVRRVAGRGETAVVFQAPTLAPWSDARSNVALPLRLSGVARDEAQARADVALARVGLKGNERLKPAQLSGGMAMRVSLARALVTSPRLLLLDEPFAALDEITRRRLADDVLALATEGGMAGVFVTHSVEEAVYMASRVLVLTQGPGRLADEVRLDAPLPRPAGFRTSEAFRSAAERVSQSLESAVG